jgi:hypothetical protein
MGDRNYYRVEAIPLSNYQNQLPPGSIKIIFPTLDLVRPNTHPTQKYKQEPIIKRYKKPLREKPNLTTNNPNNKALISSSATQNMIVESSSLIE